MREKWFGMRVGFELNSNDFKGRPATCCDLLLVLRHDWSACPVTVLEMKDVMSVEG